MFPTQQIPVDEHIAVSDEVLASMLGCGKTTAVAISKQAGARKKFGKRAFNEVDTVKAFMKALPAED